MGVFSGNIILWNIVFCVRQLQISPSLGLPWIGFTQRLVEQSLACRMFTKKCPWKQQLCVGGEAGVSRAEVELQPQSTLQGILELRAVLLKAEMVLE